MDVRVDDRGNLLVRLDNDPSGMLRERRSPGMDVKDLLPEWLVVPVPGAGSSGNVPGSLGLGGTYRPADQPEVQNLYGVMCLDPVTLPGFKSWVVVEGDWEEDESGLYFRCVAVDGTVVYAESCVLKALESVLGEVSGKVPVYPAYKGGELVARLVPVTRVESRVIDVDWLPFRSASELVEAVRVESQLVPATGRVMMVPKPGVSFEVLLAAGQSFEDGDALVVVRPPLGFGVLFRCKHGTSTLAAPAMGLPNEWRDSILDWFKRAEKLGAGGEFYLPVGDFMMHKACFEARNERLAPSAWCLILDLCSTAVAMKALEVAKNVEVPFGSKSEESV